MVNFTQESEDMYESQIKTSSDKIVSKNISLNNEIVNFDRPKYYGGAGNTYEVFNVLEAWRLDEDFYLGNVIKYLVRAGKKTSNKKEDLEKALVYLQRRINKL
jgi:Protein of unknwon function (DUF3310)